MVLLEHVLEKEESFVVKRIDFSLLAMIVVFLVRIDSIEMDRCLGLRGVRPRALLFVVYTCKACKEICMPVKGVGCEAWDGKSRDEKGCERETEMFWTEEVTKRRRASTSA